MTGRIGTNTPNLYPSPGTTALWPCSNGAAQIRVGLELAETYSNFSDIFALSQGLRSGVPNRSGAWGRGCDEAEISEEKSFFIE